VAAADRAVGVKRAAFRLQPVLELRRTEERAAAVASAEAVRAAAEADDRATQYETSLAAARLPGSMTSGAFLAAMTLLRTAATDAAEARAMATASAQAAELVRARWTAAAQRTKGLERLRERHQVAQRAAEDAAEERAVDDLVTGRAGRGGVPDSEEVPWTD
jgi:flagellar FliJ protein